ncbi:hypothetical protein [Synechococcus sp. MIT S9508]|uniref:hypothetical protein n=1 Tax=Synechococcus sp. MIT S9508 TaxID=1801629 RepID=UPI0007BC3141|nr:hypothetical protein [Synechococcus sp. MIT S9508]KZR90058.1 hypothetical protein MITS9508_01136 [Synechococcus sp. MIT S9508]
MTNPQNSKLFAKAIDECGGKEWFDQLLNWHKQNTSEDVIKSFHEAILTLISKENYEQLKELIILMDELRSRPADSTNSTGDTELDKIIEEFGGIEKLQEHLDWTAKHNKLFHDTYLEELKKAQMAWDYDSIRELMKALINTAK